MSSVRLRIRADVVFLVAAGVICAIPALRHTLGHGLVLLATGRLVQFQLYLRALGAWAPIASIALMTAEAVFVPLPATIIMVANGLVFGLWSGMGLSLLGGLLGALAAYGVGRWLGRALVERVLPATSLEQADRLMTKYGGWAVVIGRLVPGVPCDPISYAAGITRMPAFRFFVLTVLGLIPANFAMAFLGTQVAGDVPLKYWLAGCAVVVLAWLVVRSLKPSGTSERTAAGSTPPESRP